MDSCMSYTWEEFIEGFKKYVEDYGYEPDEVRPLKSWIRDYIAYLEFEDVEAKEIENETDSINL